MILALSMIACFTACGEEEAPAAETEEIVDIADPEAALREHALSVVKEIFSGNAGIIIDQIHPALIEQGKENGVTQEDLDAIVDPLNEYVADQMAILGTLGEAVVDAIDVTSMTDVDIAQLEDVYTELSLEVTAAKQVNYGVPVPTEVEDEYEITEIFSLCFVQIDGQWYIDFSTM